MKLICQYCRGEGKDDDRSKPCPVCGTSGIVDDGSCPCGAVLVGPESCRLCGGVATAQPPREEPSQCPSS